MKNWFSNITKGINWRNRDTLMFWDRSIRAKLIIPFLLVSIVPLTVIATRDTLQYQQTLKNAAETSLKSNATQTANSIDSFIQTTLDSIAAESQFETFSICLSSSPGTAPLAITGAAQDLLNKLKYKNNQLIISYALVDLNGKVLIDTEAANVGKDESGEAYFSQVQVSYAPIASGLTYTSNNALVMTFANKIRNAAGANLGYLRVYYSSAALQDVLTKSIGTTDASVLLLDPFKIRVADSRYPDLIQKSIVPLESTAYSQAIDSHHFLNIPSRELSTNLDDLDLALANSRSQPFFRADITPDIPGDDTIAVASMRSLPWIVVYGRPTSIFQAEVQNQIRTNIILVLVTLFLILIITPLIARSLANPITQLATIANKVSQGDLSARAKVRSRDEIGTLANAFNSMTSQLQETLGNLEQRVTERTAVAESARAEAEAASAEAKAARKDIETQVWLATGQTQLADVMRGEQDILQLGENVISQLCRYVDAQAGALFMLKEEKLILVGRYAFVARPGFDGNFEMGEGLVGQAALDGKMYHLEDIPSETVVISTGLADIKPREVIAFPIYANGVVAGVVEIATLTGFMQSHFELLRRVSESIGVAFRTVETRYRLAELLAESQSQAEELQAQGEELRAANEELHVQTETLRTLRRLKD